MVKAQVKVGGRGKAGGVKYAATAEDAYNAREEHPRPGHQGPRREEAAGRRGQRHRRGVLHLLPARPLQTATYLAMCSVEGGVEIEEVAATKPERLAKIPVDAVKGVDEAFARSIAEQGHLPAEVLDAAAVTISRSCGTSSSPRTPPSSRSTRWSRTPDNQILALDGKVTLDGERRLPPARPPRVRGQATPLTRWSSRPRSTTSTTSSSTARSASSATAQGLVMSTLDVVAYAGEKRRRQQGKEHDGEQQVPGVSAHGHGTEERARSGDARRREERDAK